MAFSRKILAWSFYDWANSAFATTVMAGFFPVFFKQYWAADLTVTDSTFWLGAANSAASLVVVILAPILGAIADRASAKKRCQFVFTLLGVLMTGALSMVAAGFWVLAVAVYVFGILGFSGSNVFYDALLVDVAAPRQYERVSALGYALGYLGGGILFAFDVLMTVNPHWFGLADSAEAVRLAFFSVACWWALFAIPLFILVPEPGVGREKGWWDAVRGGLSQLVATFHAIRDLRVTFLFLLAYWFYIDGVDTIVRMAVDYGLALGFEANSLMIALLITQFIGFPAALVFGQLGSRKGPKQGILIAIFVYLLVILWAYRMERVQEFYALAVAIGLVQGGIQALSQHCTRA